MTEDIKLIKGEYNGEVHYFATKNQTAIYYKINAGSVYAMLEKTTRESKPKSNKCIGLKLSYIPYDKELKIEKQQDKRVGRKKHDIEYIREKRRIASRKFYAKQREKKLLEKQEQEKNSKSIEKIN